MRGIRGWMLLLMLLLCAGAAGAEEARLAEAQRAFDEAVTRWEAGRYARAEPLHEHALGIQEAAVGANLPDVAGVLTDLARAYVDQGLYAQAEPLFARALSIREETLGHSHPLVARAVLRKALFYSEAGMYGRAEPLLERALALLEAVHDGNHPLIGETLMLLVYLYKAQGLPGHAEPVLERAMAILEASFRKDNPYFLGLLVTRANLYVAQGLYDQAEPLYARTLPGLEAAFGKRHPMVASNLIGLANLYMAQGMYLRARPLLESALARLEAFGDKNDPIVAEVLNPLANLYAAQGLYGRARPLYERAMAIQEASFRKDHPEVIATLNHLAMAHLAEHRLTQALPLFTRAFTLSEQRLREEALGFSELRLATFLQVLRTDEERLYALLRAHPGDARVRDLAMAAALLLKGRSIEESADISRAVYRSLDAQGRDTFERLRGLRTRVASLSLQGPGWLPLPAHQQRLDALSEQAAALETDLARRSAPLRALAELPPPAKIVDRVAQALPGDAALVELITYQDRPLVLGPGVPGPQLRYLALVLLPDATIHFRDLGPAEPIDSAASSLRAALANRDATFQASAQALYRLTFQPLLSLLGTTRRLFLSPDGQLALVPFAVLHDGRQFLVEDFDFTYVPSGRSLLRGSQESASPDSVVVFADPDFSAIPLAALPPAQEEVPALTRSELPGQRFFSALGARLASRAWTPTPLPGSRQEAESIKHLLPQAKLFLGAEATKQRLLRLPAPGILHLATHGFFLEDAPEPAASRGVVHFGELGEDALAPSSSDPLLRSGLVLAGAGALAPSGESSLVTALELAGLDLWGTQLVVLSACDTGRGDVKLGQGVYGLRRAFLVAGAETVVMSLWKVDDAVTRELMEAYYRHLLEGQGRALALQQAMRELRKTQPHPHYWAPFIAMGRETPLRLHASNAQQARR